MRKYTTSVTRVYTADQFPDFFPGLSPRQCLSKTFVQEESREENAAISRQCAPETIESFSILGRKYVSMLKRDASGTGNSVVGVGLQIFLDLCKSSRREDAICAESVTYDEVSYFTLVFSSEKILHRKYTVNRLKNMQTHLYMFHKLNMYIYNSSSLYDVK